MANKDQNYDKLLLGLAAVAAIGACGAIFYLKQDFGSQFTSTSAPKRGNEFGLIPSELPQIAQKRLLEAFNWDAPVKQNKAVPLNKSVLIIFKDGELHDMFLEDKPLREPMSNKFLRDNNLDFLAPNVGELDPDDDGFSNLEEYTLKTNPRDAKSLPPLRNKIYFASREQDDYKLALQSSSFPLQVKRVLPLPARAVFIEKLPMDFGFDPGGVARFTAKAFTAKKVPDPRLGEKDVSELTVLDRASNTELVLVHREEKNLATYKAKLEFRYRTVQERVAKKGDVFRFEGVGTSFRVEDVSETGASLSEQDSNGNWGQPWTVSPRP
jgi:hypothetical protein